MLETSDTSARSRSAARGWPWAVACVLVALILVVGYLAYHAMHVSSDAVKGLAAAFQPQINYKTEITGAIHDLNSNPKLVVLTATIDAEVKKSSSTSALWIYWGTTTVDVRARQNKVQFYVPLGDLGTSSFQYDPTQKTLIVWVRPPVLDEQFVDVQTDPAKIEEQTANGWAKLDHWSGAPMRDDAMHELRNAVIQAARQPAQYELLQLKAQANARQHIKTLLDPFARTLNANVKLDVEFLH
jgi:hypothetical protein